MTKEDKKMTHSFKIKSFIEFLSVKFRNLCNPYSNVTIKWIYGVHKKPKLSGFTIFMKEKTNLSGVLKNGNWLTATIIPIL